MKCIGSKPQGYINSYFIDQYLPTIAWPGGYEIGLGWASHMKGDAGGFKMLGFNGYHQFYSLPKEKRNEFLRSADVVFKKICPNLKVDLKKKDESQLKDAYKELVNKANKVRKEWKNLAKKTLEK